MTPDKNAPMAVFLASDAAKDVTGQVFGTRMNEIILFSSPRPIRIVHRAEGWTPESIAEHALAGVEGVVHAARPLGRGVPLGSAVASVGVWAPRLRAGLLNDTGMVATDPKQTHGMRDLVSPVADH